MPNYFPIMLDVRGRKALVIGGDSIAAQKAASLAASGADVLVQSQEFGEELLALHEQQRVRLLRKSYQPGDLAGAFVVIAATSDAQLAQALWTEAQASGQPINIVDMPDVLFVHHSFSAAARATDDCRFHRGLQSQPCQTHPAPVGG